MHNEAAIEQMIIDTLVKQGWEYIPAESLPRKHNDVMVESMVRDALIRLNPAIAEDPSRADSVIISLRPLFMRASASDIVTINEEFKNRIFKENTFPFGKNHEHIPITFFGMGSEEELSKNRFVVTNQWVYPQVDGGKRLDIVLLINGFPVSVGEIKTATRDAISWIDGAEDILAYEKSIPAMFVSNIFNFATEGKCYRYGSVNADVTHWGPWHTPDNKHEGLLEDVQRSVGDMIQRERILDIFKYFTLYQTDKHDRKIKVICRYQQYEGANLLVNRAVEKKLRQGLIWHFQGSGKSLLMVFATKKLRNTDKLNNATILVVLDRIDLEKQIAATFITAGVENVVIADSKEDLREKLKGDLRKVIITTIFLFDKIDECLNDRDNIILMVDEAHRTQEGTLGASMRIALPNACFFGLTGTPINNLKHNTFVTFGTESDESGYMSKYSFSDSIRDGATLPLNFEQVPVELHVDQEAIDEAFDDLTERLTPEEKDKLAKQVKAAAIIKTEDRVNKVCEHIYNHYINKVEPNGFKGMVVCYDRESCVVYKEKLDKLFGGPYCTEIVMDTHGDKENKFIAYRRSDDETTKLLDQYRDPNSPIKLLIVTAKLLTGFDAPILQVMYLDKPLKEHTLLQAICRTNRVYGETKTNGLIVDYIGIFENFAKAINFDEEAMKDVIKNIDTIKQQIPELMAKCLEFFPGIDRTDDSWQTLAAAQQCIPTQDEQDKFGRAFKSLNRVWNIVSPDPILSEYKLDYRWLSGVYESVKPASNTGHLIWSALGPKTMELIQQNITVIDVKDDAAIIETDAETIEAFMNNSAQRKKHQRKLMLDIAKIIKDHLDDPIFISLGERLELLRLKVAAGMDDSIEFMKNLLELAHDTVAAVKRINDNVVPEPNMEEKGKEALTQLFNSVKDENTPMFVGKIVDEIDGIVKFVRFPGWTNTIQGKNDVEKAIKFIFVKRKLYDIELFNKAYAYVEEYYSI